MLRKVCSDSSTMNLPSEILAEIFSRVPIKTILHCRRVCKRWCNILAERYFVNLHLSRSPAGLIIHQGPSQPNVDVLKMVELNDKADHHDIHHDPLMKFMLTLGLEDSVMWLSGSINGLICLGSEKTICICNPITRECILIPDQKFIGKSRATLHHGFGFDESSNQYKVVRFYKGSFSASEGSDELGCEVYTLGTRMWRNIGHVPFFIDGYGNGICVAGNLHWLACHQKDQKESSDSERLCAFDLDRESFQLSAGPVVPQVDGYTTYRNLGILGGCLCVCDNTPDLEFAIWVMKDYGVTESWSKEIVIRTNFLFGGMLDEEVYPLKVLKDGTIIMYCGEFQLFTYHPGTRTTQDHDFPDGAYNTYSAMVYVPSFISLRSTFMLENVLAL
ncbi:hypothetical protein DCAR_0518756 [Daucus carota subsp. sativus]|uniref:F-box domain-containing protein n=2 Tax=Daucus carota subsp. sativus TaxID=79200 RepID=A0AAF0X347_DAUCS|nr:PREDICTED: F-box protein CPR30-like [Daucus carota subsp. sativus]XP_017252186.1 PREDICTED: F-box protein CPR30-like [Daucus carota subsp. sativus]XP_017252187.1 PREDICTED: F-box protein CPR30-like [Daucus carota subsp. sativus]WOG99408.1 hypothetical protein DCAR_0518756 [Daucus carota subsp. sativus]